MSILILGKMPTNGEVIVIRPNGQATLYARGDVAFIDDPKRIYKTIELPPHGDLIDVDALIDLLGKMAENEYTPKVFANWLKWELNAPTIIPAEEE